jgi:methionyl aminopeptidase
MSEKTEMQNIKMTENQINDYKKAGQIANKVYNILKQKIISKENLDIYELTKLGNDLIEKETNQSPGFPVCISLNNCVGYYFYEKENDNIIKQQDLVKIELGVNINGSIVVYGNSFYLNDDESDNVKYIKLLDKLESKIIKNLNIDSTNDDIKILVESYCTKYDCFPVENTFSYQHLDENLYKEDSKYIVFNHQKYYDEDDNLIIKPDFCFNIDENDVYTINLTIIPNNSDDKDHIYIEKHDAHIYKYNEYYHNLKLQSSRQFYKKIKNKYGNNPFPIIDFKKDVRSRIGIKESLDNGILDSYPILYNKNNIPVFFKKFTVIVRKNETIIL